MCCTRRVRLPRLVWRCTGLVFDGRTQRQLYRWPRNSTFAGWRRRLPEGFRLSVKASRGLTHAKRLYTPELWLDRLTACWHELGDRRGVLLVQMGPNHVRDDVRLQYFLDGVPSWMRVAVEFRHPSWHSEDIFESYNAIRQHIA